MLGAFLVTVREGLEAALIVSVTLSVLARIARPELRRPAWLGVVTASALSVAAALILRWIGTELQGPSEQIFEGVTMVLAAGLLTWMILWMSRQGRQVQQKLEADVRSAARDGHMRAVFAITFLAVLREGVETALFLTAAAYRADAVGTALGALAGLTVAIFLAWGLYTATLRLNVRRFFQVTGFLLLLFAAGLVAQGVHEFNEAGVVPALIDPLWDLSSLLGEDTMLGGMLKALFGYNANPSLTEVLAYGGYLVLVAFALRPFTPPRLADASSTRGA